MTRVAALGLTVAGALALMLATVPLAAVPALGLAVPAGLVANEATGTVWHGTLRAAGWNGMALGEVDVGLAALPLLLGQARVDLAGSDWHVRTVQGSRQGILAGNGRFELPVPFLPEATATLEARQARLLFDGGRCMEASGDIRLTVRSTLVDGPEVLLSGRPTCADNQARLLLKAAPGSGLDLDMTWLLDVEGAYSVQVRVSSEDPAAHLALQMAGFQETPAGLLRVAEGSLLR